MPLNNLFPAGSYSEQSLVENLIIESVRQYGKEFYYIPRMLVAPDSIFGEDNLSKFKNSYMIEAYIDNVEEWGGSGSFISKFGYTIEDQGQLTIAKRRWEQLIGRYGQTIIPERPAEGDLMYFPQAKSLFEIKYVEHQNPFYQLGKLYVYKLKIELFQYSSERIETDIDEINQIALDMTFDVINNPNNSPMPTKRDFFSNDDFQTEAVDILNFSEQNPFGDSNTIAPNPYFKLDKLLIKYTHANSENLNTLTRIMSPYFEGKFVGYGRESRINNIISWGGDNVGSGSEYVYIDVELLRSTYPELPVIQVDLRCIWALGSMNHTDSVVLSLQGYSGGSVGTSGHTISIANSTETKNLITTTKLVTSLTTSPTDIGERIAIVTIDLLTGTASITG